MTPPRITRISAKLTHAWTLAPNLCFGALFEQIENVAWDRYEKLTKRTFSPRASQLAYDALEWAIDEWVRLRAQPPTPSTSP